MARPPPSSLVLILVTFGLLNVATPLHAQLSNTTSVPFAVTTTLAPISPTTPGTNLIDVYSGAWSDDLIPNTINAFSRVSGVPAARFALQYYGNQPAVDFGTVYLFTLSILGPTNRSGDTDSPDDAAIVIEIALNNAIGVDPYFIYMDILSAQRVIPSVRASVAASLSVDYVWVAFLLLGVAMCGVVVAIFIRRHVELSSEKLTAIDEETRRPIPSDNGDDNATMLIQMAAAGQSALAARTRKAQWSDPVTSAGRSQLFISTLDSDCRLRLPPQSIQVGQRPSQTDEAASPRGVAKIVQLTPAADKAVRELREELRDAAPPPPKRKTLREVYNELKGEDGDL